jgi:hypothetical protein
MKRKIPRFTAALPFLLALFGSPDGTFAQSRGENGLWVFQDIIPGPHRGSVNCLQYDGERFLSAGEDGFLEIWNEEQAVLRFQISALPISALVIRPGKTQIACVETDDLGQYRISVWDYATLKNLFTLRFRDPVRSLSYSAGGSYLIISRSGATGIVLADSDTGELILDPRNISDEFPPSVSFAAMGRTERVLLTYSPTGVLSYWELRVGGEPRLVPSLDNYSRPLRFEVPPNLESPALFGNNRFFAGLDREGLVILRADTGAGLVRDNSVSQGKLAGLGGELYCLVKNPSGGTRGEGILRFRMNNSDRVEGRDYFPLPAAMGVNTLLPVPSGTRTTLSRLILGTERGELLTADPRLPLAAAKKLTARAQTRIPEIAAGTKSIAFLTGEDHLGYIPLDFFDLKNGDTLSLERSGTYTRMSAAGSSLSLSDAAENTGLDRFLLWQDESPLPAPALRSQEQTAALPGLGTSFRFPLRSVSALEDRGLFLDTGGNVSVLSLSSGERLYAESFIGATDAAFIDRDSIVLGRNVPYASGITAPFLKVDIKTGETVPIPYPASVGIQVYRGVSGEVYGVAVENGEGGLRTSIIRLDIQGADSARLVNYNGEDTRFSLTEADGFLASTMGGDEAGIYAPWGLVPVERGPGLPQRITNGDLYFVVLDAEGCVSWHDPRTGNILAVFRIYEDRWTLASARAAPVRGRVVYAP